MADTLKQLFSNDKADELIEAISTPKVDKQQGTGNAGKALMVGSDGLVYDKAIEASDVTVESGTNLATRLGNVVRVDTAQTFTDTQKAQALANVGGASVDEVADLREDFNSIYEGAKTKTLEWSHGWIDSSGVYNPNSNRFLSNAADTSKVNALTNDSSSTIYIMYFSSYMDLSNFTYDSFEMVNPGATRNINKDKSFFLIESTATTNDGLSGVSLYETTPLDYLSYDNVANDKTHKQNIFFAYCSDLSWAIDGDDCSLTVNTTIRVRFDTGNASSVDTTKDAFLAIASESSLVTVNNGVVTGKHYAVIFDFTDNTIKIVDTALRTTYVNVAILFYWHYGVLGGALVNNKVGTDVSGIGELKNQVVEKVTTGRISINVDAGTTHSSTLDRLVLCSIPTDKVGFVITTDKSTSVTLWYRETENGTNTQLKTNENINGTYVYSLSTYSHSIYDIGVYINNSSGTSEVNAVVEAFIEPSNNLTTVNDILPHKQNIFFAYCSDLSWAIDGDDCSLTVNTTIRVRFDTGNASSVDTTKDAFLAIASESSLVTVNNGVVTGKHYAVIFDFTDNTIKIVDTALRTTYVNVAILFYWHYGVLGGALVNNKVAVDVTNGISGANSLEDYLEIEAVSCRDKLISACSEKSFVIAFTTDNHYGASNATNFPTTVKTINRVNELYKFDVVIDGGDLINGDKPKTEAVNLLTNAVRMVSDICDISYTLIGNHDDDSYTSSGTPLFTKQELYAMMHRHNGINLDDSDRTEHYGYKDFNSYGIRLIILDSVYGENGHDGAAWGYSDDQLTWFTTKALNTQNQVIIFSHMAFTPDYIAYGSNIKNGVAMRTAVESFISNGGIVIGLFHGHNHWDYIGQYSQTNGFKEVSTGCGRMISGPDISYAHPADAIMETRTEGTTTQELWDVIVVKPLARQVTIVRYGAGSNKANRGYSY